MTESTIRSSGLAITGGDPAVTGTAPVWPVTGDQEFSRMEEVLRSGHWSWLGPQETAFCEEYASFIGSKHCLCLANGTVTLQCALQAVGVVPGDEVIVPGLTWVATAQAAMDIGANVVLVDVDRETWCIDPKAVEAAITAKTRAIIPVHLYGCMCDMDAIMDIAKRYKLKVVEDVAHQHGSKWRDKKAGAIGDAGSFSFQQSKILTSGEGGAVTCDDDEVYRTVHSLKQVGWAPDGQPGNHYGHNYRITEMQCVLLRGGLARLEAQNKIREENALYIAEELCKMGGPLRAAKRDPRVTCQAYYGQTLNFDPGAAGITRDQYIEALAAEGFRLVTPYAPVYRSPLLNLYDSTSPVPFRDPNQVQDYANLRLPNVENIVDNTGLWIFHYHLLGNKEYVDQIINAIKKVNDNLAGIRCYFESKGESIK
jgi:dTDP-4-amino-4,6-dideoxygalactose transaminase